MVDNDSVGDLPPNVLDMLRMFLAASSRGEHVSLVLESRNNALSTKYWSVGQIAGAPAEMNSMKHEKRKMNPARLRRSKIRQEEFFRRKKFQTTRSQVTLNIALALRGHSLKGPFLLRGPIHRPRFSMGTNSLYMYFKSLLQ